ncbi:MAG: hypothetical protein DSZ23_02990 [Thermodesulfatator sp.]|nr:MAG: hypothetical protein DSZ23_02990 [Thermodesulfatator sp.]
MNARARRLVKLFLRVIVSLGLLFWLLHRVDPGKILASFRTIAPTVWLSAFVLYLISQVLSSIRWFVLARALGFAGRLITYLKFYFVGMFFNLFLPSAIGGDVLKAFFLSRGGNSKLRATYTIFFDRLMGLWAMFVLGACAAAFAPDVLPWKLRMLLFAVTVTMSLVLVFMPVFQKLINFLLPVFSRRLSSLLIYWQKPSSLAYAFTISLMLQFCGMYAVYLMAKGLGLSCRPEFYFAAFPMVAILTILPISLSGLGIREGGFVYFLGLKGVAPEKAITLSLGFFAVQAAAALLGGAGYLAGIHRETIGCSAGEKRD